MSSFFSGLCEVCEKRGPEGERQDPYPEGHHAGKHGYGGYNRQMSPSH